MTYVSNPQCRTLFRLPILCLDFDGVIHSYTSGWKGARVIPDPPVHGMLEAIVDWSNDFEIAILSSRSHRWGGRRAMKRWLRASYFHEGLQDDVPQWLVEAVAENNAMDPWADELADWIWRFVGKTIKWPTNKPPAIMTIDDRALQFKGPDHIPTADDIRRFKPWYKR